MEKELGFYSTIGDIDCCRLSNSQVCNKPGDVWVDVYELLQILVHGAILDDNKLFNRVSVLSEKRLQRLFQVLFSARGGENHSQFLYRYGLIAKLLKYSQFSVILERSFGLYRCSQFGKIVNLIQVLQIIQYLVQFFKSHVELCCNLMHNFQWSSFLCQRRRNRLFIFYCFISTFLFFSILLQFKFLDFLLFSNTLQLFSQNILLLYFFINFQLISSLLLFHFYFILLMFSNYLVFQFLILKLSLYFPMLFQSNQ